MAEPTPEPTSSAASVATSSPYFATIKPERLGTSSRFSKRKAGMKAAAAVIALAAGKQSLTPPLVQGLVAPLSSPGGSSPLRRKRKTLQHVVTPEKVPKKRPTKAKSPSNKKKQGEPVARTESFGALWAGQLANLDCCVVEPHTLILGTHPSIKSLAQQQYYGHPMNAFWWIAGDCLSFRRGTGISPSTGKPYALSQALRYGPEHILSYDDQIRRMVSSGFGMWDVVHSCERKGSLDQNIQREVPNDIRGFCEQHPSVRRIVLANGGTGSQMFVKHFRSWFATGELVAGEQEQSQKAFGRAIIRGKKQQTDNDDEPSRTITLISALSVSPAAAKYSYQEKRDFWDEHVYLPGLEEFSLKTGRDQKSL